MTIQWTLENLPEYDDDRVTVTRDYDTSDRRHLWHTQHICIDGVIVYSAQWYVDDDFDSCSQEPPNSRAMWDSWVKTLAVK